MPGSHDVQVTGTESSGEPHSFGGGGLGGGGDGGGGLGGGGEGGGDVGGADGGCMRMYVVRPSRSVNDSRPPFR